MDNPAPKIVLNYPTRNQMEIALGIIEKLKLRYDLG